MKKKSLKKKKHNRKALADGLSSVSKRLEQEIQKICLVDKYEELKNEINQLVVDIRRNVSKSNLDIPVR